MTAIIVATDRGLYDARTSRVLALEGRKVDALSPDAHWAVVDGREVWANDDGWSRVASSTYTLTCIVGLGGVSLVGTVEAHLLRLQAGQLEVVEAFETVEGREEWFTPWGGPPAVRSFALSHGDVYVNIHVGGIVRGRGDSWSPTIDITTDVHEVRAADGTLVVACAEGFAESSDRGKTWEIDDVGLHATYARAIAVGRHHLLMSVANGPRGGDAAVYRKPRDGTRSFARCDLPPFRDNIDSGCLDAWDEVAAFGTREGQVFASHDDGATWHLVADDLPRINHLVVASDSTK